MQPMNVTEEVLQEYLDVFNRTLRETAEQYLPPELQGNLFHLALLPAHIVAYLSTQFGLAIEYRSVEQADNGKTTIRFKKGSDRVENLLFPIPPPMRSIGTAMSIGGSNVRMSEVSISGLVPFRLENSQASVFMEDSVVESSTFYTSGIPYKFRKHVRYAEVFGNREKDNWSREKAVRRAMDEVLAALSEIKRSELKNISISEFIETLKSKTVLLLGAYDSEGLKRLRGISSSLVALGYEPLLIKDVPDIQAYNLSQKLEAIGPMARFIVIDDSLPSGHLIEVEICRRHDWVTVLLRAGGHGASWMTAGASTTSNVILERGYTPSDPAAAITEATTWAEETLERLERDFNSIYPWRDINS